MTIDLGKAAAKFQLSRRETEVVRLVCQGMGNKEIGETLFVCEFTVKDHIKAVMGKMDAANRTSIVSAVLHFSGVTFKA